MTATVYDLTLLRLLTAARIAEVADAAGVPHDVWSSETSPRVLPGDHDTFLHNLHRGRLPAIEVFQLDDAWDRQSVDGGTVTSRWMLRGHAKDLLKPDAESRLRLMLTLCCAAARSDEYLGQGEESFGELVQDPLGFRMELTLSVVHTYSRGSYETNVTITPGAPPVIEVQVPGPQGPQGEPGPAGPQGPPGADGGAAPPFEFVQNTPSASWTIVHNLGYRPASVSVVDSGGNVVGPAVVHIDDNELVINFGTAFSGTALLR